MLFLPTAWFALATFAPLSLPLTLAVPARADVVVIAPARDNTLFATGGETSNGAGDAVFSGRTGGGGGGTRQRAVLAFDVAEHLPAGSTVTDVALTLHLVSAGARGGEETLALHRILADWGEGASSGTGGRGAPSAPDDATWLHTFFPDAFWVNAGGDFDPAPIAAALVGESPGPYIWNSTPAMVAVVQSWLDAPETDFGWVILGNEEDLGTARKFHSRESPEETARPALVVAFDPPPACPGDIDGDGAVRDEDLFIVLDRWGPCPPEEESCPGDVDGDREVGFRDIVQVLVAWGACPE